MTFGAFWLVFGYICGLCGFLVLVLGFSAAVVQISILQAQGKIRRRKRH